LDIPVKNLVPETGILILWLGRQERF
jgi:hypothetical protein